MKKITLLIFLGILVIAVGCNQSQEPNSLETTSSENEISINKKSQVKLNPTTLSLDEIENTKCGEGLAKTLFAGQHINVGTLLVSNDDSNLYVTYKTDGNWFLTESHLYVGSYNNLPLNGGGNPKIGNFPYHGDHEKVNEYTFTIPLNQINKDASGCFVVAAHGVVKEYINGEATSSETAWAKGDDEFPGNRWGWYITYCEEECVENKCMTAASYKMRKPENSVCYEYTDNDDNRVAWATKYSYHWLNSINYSTDLPLFANPDDCKIESGHLSVAQVDIELSDDGSELTVVYSTKPGYLLTGIDLYVGLEQTPINTDGTINNNLNDDNFIIESFDGIGKTTHTVTIPWEGPTNGNDQLIWISAQADICTSVAD